MLHVSYWITVVDWKKDTETLQADESINEITKKADTSKNWRLQSPNTLLWQLLPKSVQDSWRDSHSCSNRKCFCVEFAGLVTFFIALLFHSTFLLNADISFHDAEASQMVLLKLLKPEPFFFQDVWNYFPRFRLHILVHDLADWDPKLWRRQLGTSFTGVFGGLHWCGSAT